MFKYLPEQKRTKKQNEIIKTMSYVSLKKLRSPKKSNEKKDLVTFRKKRKHINC